MPAGAPFDVGVLFGDRFDDDALLLDVLPHISTVCRSTYHGSTLGDAPCSAFRRRETPPAAEGSCCVDDDVVLISIDVVFGDAFCDEQAERLSDVGARATTMPPPTPLLLLMVAEDSAAVAAAAAATDDDAGEGFGVFMVD